MAKSKLGFHLGPGGKKNGLGDWERQLNLAGIPFGLKAVDTYGPIYEAVEIGRQNNVQNWLGFRFTHASGRLSREVPDYNAAPWHDAPLLCKEVLNNLPPEFDKSVWLEVINEPRDENVGNDTTFNNMNATDYLGEWCLAAAKYLNERGYKFMGPSFNAGRPGRDRFPIEDAVTQYSQPGMLKYLRYCAENPSLAALSVHDYSWSSWKQGQTANDWYPGLWGRFEAAIAAADLNGIPRTFHIFVTEFGFAHNEAPKWPEVKPYLEARDQMLARWPQVKYDAAWSLQEGWKDIDTHVNSWLQYNFLQDFPEGEQPARTHKLFGGTLPNSKQAIRPPEVAAKPSVSRVATDAVKFKRVTATSGLRMRSGPSIEHDILQTLTVGTVVEVLQEGEWDYIRVGSTMGFSSSQYLASDTAPPQREKEAGRTLKITPNRYVGPKVDFVAGIHGPGDAFTWHDAGFRNMLTKLGMPVKFMSDGDRFKWYKEFRKPSLDLVRVFWSPDPRRKKTAQQAWDEDIRDGVLNFYRSGARHFEIHNEPSLAKEGMTMQWKNGEEFGAFIRDLMQIIKQHCPEAKLWYPGESPGVPWTNQFAFSRPAYNKVADLCYGICQHAYSGNTTDVSTAVREIVDQVKQFHGALQAWDKPIIVSECSVNRAASDEFRAKVYTKVAQELRHIAGVQGVFWYISHWNAPPNEIANAENWYCTNLPELYRGLNQTT